MDAEGVCRGGRKPSKFNAFLEKSGGGRDYIEKSCNFVGEKL